MKFTERYTRWFQRMLPSPFSIAIVLTLLTFGIVLWKADRPMEVINDWQTGLWSEGLLAFAFQMMMMLVLGHVLALSSFFNKLTDTLLFPIKNQAQAAFVVCFSTIVVAFLNWGLALIFGALLARKIGEQFTRKQQPLNYPLIGAAGYVGLMVWHGGISGSSLIKAAESGHIQQLAANPSLPDAIPYADTVFSTMNLTAFALLLILLPGLVFVLARRSNATVPQVEKVSVSPASETQAKGAEKLDQLGVFSKSIGALMVVYAVYLGLMDRSGHLGFITPNYINFCLLAASFTLHRNFRSFLQAVDRAIQGASGILIQFPLYFGILALLKSGGLIEVLSDAFIHWSTVQTLPLFTFVTSGLVNIFVPSGGGQWAIQGPILLEAGQQVGVPLSKMVMALAYGDQLTNMLQPFWALPLLSITGLKAKQILPYTLLLFLVGGCIFSIILLLF